MFDAQRLKHCLQQLEAADSESREAIWAEALVLIQGFLHPALKRLRASADEAEDVSSAVILGFYRNLDRRIPRICAMTSREIPIYFRVCGGNELIRLRRVQGRQPSLTLPVEIRRPLGREPEPDELERAQSALAGLDGELRFILRAVMMGFRPDEIHAALGAGSKARVYERINDGAARIVRAIQRGGDGKSEKIH